MAVMRLWTCVVNRYKSIDYETLWSLHNMTEKEYVRYLTRPWGRDLIEWHAKISWDHGLKPEVFPPRGR